MRILLTRLTLIVVAVVVGVVATYLVLIAAALIRANRNLAELAGGLEAIRDNTGPLGEDLSTINSAAIKLRERLTAVDRNLSEIARSVRGQSL